MTDEVIPPSDGESATAAAGAEEEVKWPIGFMVILALAAIYVGWRVVQMVGNLFG